MKRTSTEGHHRHSRELLFFLLLSGLLGTWILALVASTPHAVTQPAGATWRSEVNRCFHLIEVALLAPGTLPSDIRALTVLPPTGAGLKRYAFANLSAEALADRLAKLDRFDTLTTAEKPQPETWQVRFRLDDFTTATPDDPQQFSALAGAELLPPHGASPVVLFEQVPLRGSNTSLPWFVLHRTHRGLKALLILLSLGLMAPGLGFAVIYYRLVDGVTAAPSWLIRPINTLRASSGLIASSLLFLTGGILLLLLIMLTPHPGPALDAQRTHTDILIDAGDAVVPARAVATPSHQLPQVASHVAEAALAAVMAASEEAPEAGLTSTRLGSVPFWHWLRHGFPRLLATRTPEITVSRGATWRLFAAANGEVHSQGTELRWPADTPEARRQTVLDLLTSADDHWEERESNMPLVWSEAGLPPLAPSVRRVLRETDSAPSRYACLLLTTGLYPSQDALERVLTQSLQRPDEIRIYAVLLPALPRSAVRPWESFESRVLTAHAFSDRVTTLFPIPETVSEWNPKLQDIPFPDGSAVWPNLAVPFFPQGGEPLVSLHNFSVPVDLALMRSAVFSAPDRPAESAARLGRDFQRWFLGAKQPLTRVPVFTIPRLPFYCLVLGLGIIFLVASTRCEQNAQALHAWMPPLVVLCSAVLVPLLVALWVYSRGDTTRFVLYGYADLACWGAGFFWYCLAVAPLFQGRARVGIRRDAWMNTVVITCVVLMAAAPLVPASWRAAHGALGLVGVTIVSVLCALAILVRPPREPVHRLRKATHLLTLALFIACAGGYLALWGWDGQDFPALTLGAVFLTMVVSGWADGPTWWRIESTPFYDRIVWLHPVNRLTLALLLTLAGSAVLYCSFPTAGEGGWIRGYLSYCLLFCVLPILSCVAIVVLVDFTRKEPV